VQLCRLLFEMGPRVRISLPPPESLRTIGPPARARREFAQESGALGRAGHEAHARVDWKNSPGAAFFIRRPR
jgi:hypothetical protein